MNIDILLSFFVVLISLFGLVVSRNIIKSIICFNMLQASAVLLFLNFVHSKEAVIPILSSIDSNKNIVDPLPQALMITAIVIGAAITALALMFSIKIFHYYGTLDWDELIKREG
ncbi:sodium:proton antiporter [Thermohalobacter berrensis]|uniref:Sodium:proton antiporter n=1 Tax=Thermohalobacter berrensis TaxID=99594 RepID=A0A419SZ93_9FIRM|nr:cation:proton antiporter subunit C [Thermohalobacter berrensis]RKD30580.1 sodium:proton antiporter [Thermohalobacter berrensis]